jgi:hypothetical protein
LRLTPQTSRSEGNSDNETRKDDYILSPFSQRSSTDQIHDKELMAIIEAFKEWRPHLSGTTHQVKVYTDHKNLTYFTTTKELNKRQTRWAEFLSEYNFKIIYRKGNENGRADALSRRTDHEQDQAPEHQTILQVSKDGNLEQSQREISALLKVHPSEEWTERFKQLEDHDKTILDHGDPAVPRYHGKLYVPEALQQEFVKEFHETPSHGHQGIAKTTQRLQTTYDFPGLRRVVKEVVSSCKCAQDKASRHKPYGELKPLPIADRAWGSIAFDHIVKLPPSKEPMTRTTYDSIFVITDRLTKYGYFIPYKEASSAEDLAYTFLRIVVSNHGLPDEIISDRGTTFASHFWQSLTAQLGVNHKLSTAYHPQTDGQTERLNQTLEQYLRSYVNYQQDNWVTLLPLAQFAYNSSHNESTKCSPFFANYGFDPEIHRASRHGREVPKAYKQAKELKALHQELRQELAFTQGRMAQYYNQKRLKGPTFERGDKVYLIRKNIKTKRPSDKLDHKKLGPFEVTKRVSDSNYELRLPTTMRIHPIFHISLLEPAPRNARLQEKIEVDAPEGEYEVETILSSRKQGTVTQYLIKWLGYDDSENTWEPAKHLKHCQQMLEEFHRQNPDQPSTKDRATDRRGPGRPNQTRTQSHHRQTRQRKERQ